MTQISEGQARPRAPAASAVQQAGRYVYCVVRASEDVSLSAVGIAGGRVYAVGHNDLRALVHDCPAQPYQSDDAEVAAAWVLAHHHVVDIAWKRWGTVLPLAFNTIIRAGDESSADENLVAWLRTQYESLTRKLNALAGKSEYGIQVFWDAVAVARNAAETSPDIRRLEEEIQTKSRGLAYMYRHKLENLLKKKVETKAAEEFKDLYGRLSRCVDSVHVEKVKKGQEGLQMLMNLSCLVSPEKLPDLEAELDRISATKGHAVRLVGPLPPYSFC